MKICDHENECDFIGDASLVGNYRCRDCGFKIDPIVYHYANKMPHSYFEVVAPFTDWEKQKQRLKNLIDGYFEYRKKSLYQSPRWDHEPTEVEIEQEEKERHFCHQYKWQMQVYGIIIATILNANFYNKP